MLYKELSDSVLGAIFTVHKGLGPGLLEMPYQNALFYKLKERGISVQSQVPFHVLFEGYSVGDYFADLVVENKIIIEVKAVKQLTEIMEAQLINCLRISRLQVGYLVNFRNASAEWKRLVNFPCLRC